jgi:tRNA1(Val) A37 N6-methylase TrmN6
MNNEIDVTTDKFLGGELVIRQPKNGYRAGIDAVLLGTAASTIHANDIVELGCGVGTALLITAKQRQKNNPVRKGLGIEIDHIAASLALKNIVANGFGNDLQVETANGLVANSTNENSFELAVSNPPFFDDGNSIRAPSTTRETAYIIGAPLLVWLKAMLRLVKSNGHILLIHRADRLYDILKALQGRAGDIRVLPIHAVEGRAANRVLICAKKGSKAPTQILQGIALRAHQNDSKYLPEIDAICNGALTDIFIGLSK